MSSVSGAIQRMDVMTGQMITMAEPRSLVPASPVDYSPAIIQPSERSLVPVNSLVTLQRMEKSNQHNLNLIGSINNDYRKMNMTINRNNISLHQTNNTLILAAEAQEKVNKGMSLGQKLASGLVSKLKSVVSKYTSLQSVKIGMKISDDYMSGFTRLSNINDGLHTTDELQDKIFASAGRSRGSYADMANMITKMSSQAPDLFGSNDEAIAFTELMQKSFKTGGAGGAEQQAGMNQLANAMTTGKLQGDEFKSLMAINPMLAQAIADFTGKSQVELIALAAEGAITADIVKGAMFSAADDINSEFSSMPIMFSDIFTRIKDVGMQSFGGLFQRISELLNSDIGKQVVANIETAIASVATVISFLLASVIDIFGFIATNWPTIEPIIWGLAAATTAWLIASNRQAITQALLAVMSVIVNGALFIQTASVLGLSAAWQTLNAAQRANVFILIISLVAGLIVWLVRLWQTNDNFVAGVMRAWNWLANAQDQIDIGFAKVGIAMVNTFQSAKVGVLRAIESMINDSIDKINWFIEQSNKFLKTGFETIAHVQISADAAIKADSIKQAGEDAIALLEENAAKKAADREQRVLDMLEDRAAKRAEKAAEDNAYTYTPTGYTPVAIDNMGKVDKVGEVGKINDTVDISSEDLKTMRELAEMNNIQNFVSVTPSVSFGDTHVRSETDINTIITRISTLMEQEMAGSAEGVYS